jgi:hypothetical protein
VAALSLVDSQQPAPTVLPSRAQAEASLALLEKFDGMAGMRNGIRRIAGRLEEWAGIPMPLDGEQLVIEPSYRRAAELMAIGKKPDANEDAGLKLRNQFWSTRRRCNVLVIEDEKGRVSYGMEPGAHHFGMDLQTLGCSDAWGVEQESNAVHTLAGLVRHRQFKQYLLTGMFIERSQRSGLSYCFRRLKPTVVLDTKGPSVRIRCTLCMHPIAYYANTWAGAMCPTDDVIAHLMLMRGDEVMLWKRSNQHPAYRPESGL